MNSDNNIYLVKSKIIFKLCGVLGIVPLETNSYVRNIHLFLFLTLNLIGFVRTPFEVIKIIEIFEITIQESLMSGISQVLLFLLNFLSIYGIFKKKDSWNKFFNIMDKLSADVSTKTNTGPETFIIIIFFKLIILSHFLNMWLLLGETLTFVDSLCFCQWIWSYLQCFGVTVTMWKISKILSLRYAYIINVITLAFSEKKLNTKDFSTKLFQIKEYLHLLNGAVILVNSIMGKMLFIMIASAFLNTLSFVNFSIFLFKTNKFYEETGLSLISLLISSEIAVSQTFFIFFSFSTNK